MATTTTTFNPNLTTFNPNLTTLPLRHRSPKPKPPCTTTIRCGAGPRSNRGPLVKGRVLSIEAIQAVQTLKRVHKQDPNTTHFPFLSRLIKYDLIAALRELLRQDLCTLALPVLSTVRSEYPPVDLGLCSDVVHALTRNKLWSEIDRLICELEREQGEIEWGEDKGLVRLVKGVVAAERKESTLKIVGMMKRSGCGDTWTADDYVVKVLSKGLRRFGEEELADEVEREFGWVNNGNLDKIKV